MKSRWNHFKLLFVCMTALAAMGGGSALAASEMGWNENFSTFDDGDEVNGTRGWQAPTSVVVQAVVTQSVHKALKVPETAAATNVFDGTQGGFVWTDMYAQPLIGDAEAELSGQDAALFYFDGDGYPVTYNGTLASWQTNTSVAAISTGAWTRITIFQNFTEQRWYLFVNGTNVGDRLGFGFASAVSRYNRFSLEHSAEEDEGNAAYFDDMWVYTSRPDGTTSNANEALASFTSGKIMENAWQLDYFGNLLQSDYGDYDGDGYKNAWEYLNLKDPTDPSDPGGLAAVLPYRQGFENVALGAFPTNAWQGLTATGTVTVQASHKAELNRALKIESEDEGAAVTLSVNDSTATQVWARLYLRPVFMDEPPESTNDTAVFYINTNSTLCALDGTSWTNLTENIPSNTWLGFAVHLDYDQETWDLYVSTNGTYGAPMAKANPAPLSFATNLFSNFTNLIVESGSAAYVDALAVSYAYDTSGGWATNSVAHTNVVAHDRLAGQLNPSGRPPYNYTAGVTDHLDAELGADFALGLYGGSDANRDRLRAYTNGWNVYEWNVDAWSKQSGLDPENLHVTATMGIQIERRYPADVVVFYPYGAALTVNDQPIFGSDHVTQYGWNMLAWPWASRAANATGGTSGNWGGRGAWGFDGIVEIGDRIVVIENNVRRDFYWKNSRWYEGASTASYVLKTGQGFWYYRAGVGTTWPVSEVGD